MSETTHHDASAVLAEELRVRGFAGPFTVFDSAEAHRLATALARSQAPDTWPKGCAAKSTEWFDVATRPEILDRVSAALGGDVLLCGANLVHRIPRQVHAWHVDTHLVEPVGASVTVWIGLENVNASSALRVVPGSHAFGFSPEERAAGEGRDANDVTDADAVRWARDADPDATPISIQMGVGDAVFIHGALWHGTRNETADERVAMLLHYTTPDKPVRLHAPITRWPFRRLDAPRPPCQIVRGSDRCGVNRLVPAPGGGTRRSAVYATAPAFAEASPVWKPDPLYVGATGTLAHLVVKTNHVFPRGAGHRMHAHADEQLALGLDGGVTMRFGGERRPLELGLDPGVVVYVPPGTRHVEESDGEASGRQIEMTWLGTARRPAVPLGLSVRAFDDVGPDLDSLVERGRSAVELLDGPTATIDRLRVLRVDMRPGFTGADDTDAYDVVLIVMAGRIATLDRVAGVSDVVLYRAGETHSISVVGDDDVQLLVIELHNSYVGPSAPRVRSLRRAITARLPRRVRVAVRRARAAIRR